MMNWLRLRLLIKHMNLKTLIPLSLLCRVDHRYRMGFAVRVWQVWVRCRICRPMETLHLLQVTCGWRLTYMSLGMVVQGWWDSGSGRVCHVLILLWHVWQGSFVSCIIGVLIFALWFSFLTLFMRQFFFCTLFIFHVIISSVVRTKAVCK